MTPARLNLQAIDASLCAVQADFGRINRTLAMPRDPMTDEVRANMLAGYRFVDEALARGLDAFGLGQSGWLLELNTLVLCGTDEAKRREFEPHIAATARHFYGHDGDGVGAFIGWLERHRADSVWRRAAGAYIHILSQPQLYLEGNHRTGALIMSYILAREGQPPFVLSVGNARAYFDPSSLIKATHRDGLGLLLRMPKLKKRLAALIKNHAGERFLVASTAGAWRASADQANGRV